jgi:hypothetical protein
VTDAARIARILAAVSDADRAWLERRIAPAWLRRQRRLEARDEAVREIAAEHYATLTSGRAIAQAICRHMALYAAAGRLNDSLPADPRRAALHRLLELSGGRVPAERTVRAALAGIGAIGGQNSPSVVAHDPVSTLSWPGAARDDDEDSPPLRVATDAGPTRSD